MKTQREFVTEVIAAKVASGIEKDMVKKQGFGDRIKKAGEIVLRDGVHPVSYNDFDVASGTDSEKTYHVNGECECQDAVNWTKKAKGEAVKTFAPSGYCKHRLAVELWKHARAAMKELTDKGGNPHTWHRWTCTEHRDLPIVCWHHPCPDPIDVDCPTCTAQHDTEVEADREREDSIDITTGEITETPFADEETPMMSTIGETIKSVVASLNGHTNGASAPEPEAAPLVPEQYEPAPVLAPKMPAMPEAPVSFYIKFKVENFELSYTMRAHTDAEVIARLPGVLAGLEDVLKIEVDHEENFLKRLMHAFFPKPSRYTGK
jgi:hypothetical protein